MSTSAGWCSKEYTVVLCQLALAGVAESTVALWQRALAGVAESTVVL